jgi:hypothetical protein
VERYAPRSGGIIHFEKFDSVAFQIVMQCRSFVSTPPQAISQDVSCGPNVLGFMLTLGKCQRRLSKRRCLPSEHCAIGEKCRTHAVLPGFYPELGSIQVCFPKLTMLANEEAWIRNTYCLSLVCYYCGNLNQFSCRDVLTDRDNRVRS